MANSTYDRGPMGTVKQKFDEDFVTRAMEREIADRAIVKARAAAYAQVNVRDENHCRACDCVLMITLRVQANRREHHHVDGRGGIEKEVTSNICLLCNTCHQRVTLNRMSCGGNADDKLTFDDHGQVWHSWPHRVFEHETRTFQRD